MNSITVKTPHDSSFSISKKFFHWKSKVDDDEEILTFDDSSDGCEKVRVELDLPAMSASKKNLANRVVSKLRSALTIFNVRRSSSSLGTKVIGTLFGHRRGHIHFAIQEDPKSNPVFLIELAMPTSDLVREMASGLVRIALECEKKAVNKNRKGAKLIEEALWSRHCNGKKSGYAMRRDCGAEVWKVLKAVEPVSMGAGVLPNGNGDDRFDGEVMFMRAKFERVVGSPDSEAFYMMNPDGGAGPELSFYLLRV